MTSYATPSQYIKSTACSYLQCTLNWLLHAPLTFFRRCYNSYQETPILVYTDLFQCVCWQPYPCPCFSFPHKPHLLTARDFHRHRILPLTPQTTTTSNTEHKKPTRHFGPQWRESHTLNYYESFYRGESRTFTKLFTCNCVLLSGAYP